MNLRGYLRECAHAENVRGFCGGTRVIDRVRYRLFQSGQHVSMAHGRKNVCKLDMEFFFCDYTHLDVCVLACVCVRVTECFGVFDGFPRRHSIWVRLAQAQNKGTEVSNAIDKHLAAYM